MLNNGVWLQQGAEAAGISEQQFRGLPLDKQRFFVFGLGKDLHKGRISPDKFQQIKVNIAAGVKAGTSRDQLEAQIDAMASAQDKLELYLYLDTFVQPGPGFFTELGGMFGL